MKVVYGDAPSELAEMLRTALPGPVTVRTRVPTDAEPYDDDDPLVVVTQNAGGQTQHRANARVPIRGMVWHQTDDEAFDLAQLVLAHVHGHSGQTVRSVIEPTTPYVTADPDSGQPLASFIAVANVRAQRIA